MNDSILFKGGTEMRLQLAKSCYTQHSNSVVFLFKLHLQHSALVTEYTAHGNTLCLFLSKTIKSFDLAFIYCLFNFFYTLQESCNNNFRESFSSFSYLNKGFIEKWMMDQETGKRKFNWVPEERSKYLPSSITTD